MTNNEIAIKSLEEVREELKVLLTLCCQEKQKNKENITYNHHFWGREMAYETSIAKINQKIENLKK